MTRRWSALGQDRAKRPLAAAGILALALAAGCGSSGTGRVVGAPPTATPTETPTPTEFPGPSTSPTETPSETSSPSSELQDFSGFGVSLTVPDGYVLATTPAEAAERFPSVLSSDPQEQQKISDAQTRLRGDTVMVAFRSPINGLSDNIGLLRLAGQGPSADVQSLTFQSQARTSLSNVGARNIEFTDTDLGGQPAEQVNYTITKTGPTVYGEQFYVANGQDVFILTISTGTADRTSSAGDDISNSWEFS